MLATAEQRPKVRALGFAQLDPITYVHLASPSREAQMNRSCSDVREKLHREAGAILRLHRRLYPRPRPSPGRDRHAAPFPAHPAFRAPDGPHAGAPRPYPPPARRRAQHRGAPRPPRLARSPSPPTSQIHCAEELAEFRSREEKLKTAAARGRYDLGRLDHRRGMWRAREYFTSAEALDKLEWSRMALARLNETLAADSDGVSVG